MDERREQVERRIASLEGELLRLREELRAADAARAAALAERPRMDLPVEALVVYASGFVTAVPARQIEEVTPMSLVSPIPHAPVAVRGTVNYRGSFAPVLDLRYVLSGTFEPLDPDMRLVFVRTETRLFTIAVDEVESVRSFGEEDVEPAPLVSTLPEFVEYIFRGEQRGVALLEPSRLFASAEAGGVYDLPLEATEAQGSE